MRYCSPRTSIHSPRTLCIMTVNSNNERSLVDSSPPDAREPARDSHLSCHPHIGDVGDFKLREKMNDEEDGDSDGEDSDMATVVGETPCSKEKKQDVCCNLKDSETRQEWTCSVVQAWVTRPAQDKRESSGIASHTQNETPIFAYWQQRSGKAVWNCPVLGTFDVGRGRSARGEFAFSVLYESGSVIAI